MAISALDSGLAAVPPPAWQSEAARVRLRVIGLSNGITALRFCSRPKMVSAERELQAKDRRRPFLVPVLRDR